MPKRKRDGDGDASPSTTGDRAIVRQIKLCAERLEIGKKALIGALKLAAGFERQKYSRRHKEAQSKNDIAATQRLEDEYKVLKALDAHLIAEIHLRKVINKVKLLAGNEALPDWAKEKGRDTSRDQATLNVLGRLYKVQAVKKAVDGTVEDLKAIVGDTRAAQALLDKKKQKTKDRENTEAKKNITDAREEYSGDESDEFAEFEARIAAHSSSDESDDESVDLVRRPPTVTESDEEDGEDVELFDSDEISASETESRSRTTRSASFASFASESEDEDSSEASGSPVLAAKTSRQKPETPKPTTSTFLPSLSHAAYISDPDSSASDIEDHIAPRKNRRGQRARQQIWEKKFGETAKHLKQQERNKGWDAKKGAVDESKPGRGAKGKGGKGGRSSRKAVGRGPDTSGANDVALGNRKKVPKKDDSGPLHPSWQAAKMAKEKKLDMKPQGKKITFD